MMDLLQTRFSALRANVERMGSVAVAFSGGVDSAFLLAVAHEAVGGSAMAVTVRSCLIPAREMESAYDFTASRGIRHVVCDVDALAIPGVRANAPDRCYHCKRSLMEGICRVARANGMAHVAEGSNVDDDSDYRPGRMAVSELGIESPLRDAGLTKADVRELSRQMGLPAWDKPAFACLASRIPSGTPITPAALRSVERAELLLFAHGFRQVRVRCHGDVARIEIDLEDMEMLLRPATRQAVEAGIRAAGFAFVTLDLRGYRVGSMNVAE